MEAAAAAIEAGTGFSLIRLGDGEAPILCWPQHQAAEETRRVLTTWFGRGDLPDGDLNAIAEGLRHAVRTADVLGLPTRFQLTRTQRYGMVFKGIEIFELHDPTQLLADSGLHWYLQWSGALARLLRGLKQVDVIACRDIGPEIAGALSIPTVRMHLVRGEHRFPGVITQSHWPDGYNEIIRELEAVRPGQVFLVGAGVLGKIYCDRIKAKGGIALDIGSLLDSWANIATRDRYEWGSSAFSLEHLKSADTAWEAMLTALRKWAAELHARDQTVTL